MSNFKIIETQEELDAVIKARLSREREKYADYEDLKKQLADFEDLKKQLADFEAKELTYQNTINDLKTRETDLASQIETLKFQSCVVSNGLKTIRKIDAEIIQFQSCVVSNGLKTVEGDGFGVSMFQSCVVSNGLKTGR